MIPGFPSERMGDLWLGIGKPEDFVVYTAVSDGSGDLHAHVVHVRAWRAEGYVVTAPRIVPSAARADELLRRKDQKLTLVIMKGEGPAELFLIMARNREGLQDL